MTAPPALPASSPRLRPAAAAAMRAAIRLAGGREVCFVGVVDEQGVVQTARTVARGDASCVLALPGFATRGEMLLHNHPSGLLEPSNADLEIAARIHMDGIGFGIIDNEATELYVVVEIPVERTQRQVDGDSIDADLGTGGAIAAQHARFEDRPSQRQMARQIARLYNLGGIGLLEAGTGVGKSLAYLLPALRWAAANGERTVVSTNTINLQEQLVGVDLPFLRGALSDQPVRFALLKGWRNYLCLLRLEQARAAGGGLLDEGMSSELDALAHWAARTTDGSRSDLPTQPRPEVWDEVAAESDLCTRFRCPHFDRCFLFTARRQAAQADVVVVNHHLLLSDLAVRRMQDNWGEAAVLPAYDRLVVDEGHHLEEAAASHLGASVSRLGLARLVGRLDRKGKGLLRVLDEKLRARDDMLSAASLDLVKVRLLPSVHAVREKGGELFDLLSLFLQESGRNTVRLTDDFTAHRIWRAGLEAALTDVLQEFELMAEGLRMVRERLETDPARQEELAPVLNEIRAVSRRLAGAGDALEGALRPEKGAEVVRWVEMKGGRDNVSVSSVPLQLAPILRDDLFRRLTTAVVTSATLSTDGRFDFLASRLGLTDDTVEPVTATYPSPFDYPVQALLAVPTDVPLPALDSTRHADALARIVLALAEEADGGIFVLLTSHRDLRQCALDLRAHGAAFRWPLLVQGEDDARDVLLRRFRESGRAVLLGTASFWEGVDVPGRALRGLVIGKLPFRVPTDPMTAAQCEAIEARGGDSFAEYMLPHAALRLKQGFGRLIRSASDRGAIILADPRVVTKNYGRGLLDSLPPARRVVGPWSEVRPALAHFYRNGARE